MAKPAATQSVYGLDIDILKSLNLEELIEDKRAAQEEKKTTKIDTGDDVMNKTMSELRSKYSKEPGLHTRASKLRQRVAMYKDEAEPSHLD